MPTADERLAGVRAKIERAKQHVLNVDGAARAFLDSNPCEGGTKRDPDTRRVLHYLVRVKPAPVPLRLIVGDALHNLRSALDHLAWQLVEAGGGTPTRYTAYPIMETNTTPLLLGA